MIGAVAITAYSPSYDGTAPAQPNRAARRAMAKAKKKKTSVKIVK